MGDVPRLAVVHDRDPALRGSLAAQIRAMGVERVVACGCGARLRDLLDQSPPDVILVTGLRDAVEGPALVARCRRAQPRAVIIALDHLCDGDSSADTLAAGADDVLRVPHPPREFAARLALRLRQAGVTDPAIAPQAEPIAARAQLTPVESEIVRLLMSSSGRIVTRNQLSRHLDKADWLYGDRKFDVHVTKIRKKLQAAFGDRYVVRTIRSEGYLFDQGGGEGGSGQDGSGQGGG